ncbi:MAG: hypothetical protein Pg6C_07890 [Treponemataceae bacterium]|nr:MAG: hypothetical protein Pg6C_07890 [Treponemataceae bacterium]
MEKTGLINKITEGVGMIAEGRQQLMTKGMAEAGLAYFNISYFEAALDTLPLTDNKEIYKAVNTAFSPHPEQRHKGFPKDAVHMACASALMRIKNGLSRIGIPEADISLAAARTAMLKAAQDAYCARQHEALRG